MKKYFVSVSALPFFIALAALIIVSFINTIIDDKFNFLVDLSKNFRNIKRLL